MGLPFELEIHSDYIQIKHPAGVVIDPNSTQDMWAEIGRLCGEHGRSKVLIQAERPTRHLDTMEAFDSGRVLAENTSGLTIAVCFTDYEFDDLTTFFKTVAQNRGVRIDFFPTVEEAVEWLGVKTGELSGHPR